MRMRTRHRFTHEWAEITYLYDKCLYWLYIRNEPRRSRTFVQRLKRLVTVHDAEECALLGARSKALIADFEDDIEMEIHYTQHTINLLNRLLFDVWPDVPDYDCSDIQDYMEILVLLYAENEQPEQALKWLRAYPDNPMKLPMMIAEARCNCAV